MFNGPRPATGRFRSCLIWKQTDIWDKLDLDSPPAYPGFGPHVAENFINGRKLREISVPYAHCPSDEFDDVIRNAPANPDGQGPGPVAVTNYSANRGQMELSLHGGCQQYSNSGVILRTTLNQDVSAIGSLANSWGDCYSAASCSGIVGNAGYGAKLSEILDGTSNTIAVGEILPECRDDIQMYGFDMWSSNRHSHNAFVNAPPNFDTCPPFNQGPCDDAGNWPVSRGFKSKHAGGVQFALCDGSARFISESIDLLTYWRLGERADEQVTGNF